MHFLDFLPSFLTASHYASTPIAAATTVGRVHTSSDKLSQDRFGVNSKLSAKGFMSICVCDGHGPEGEVVAEAAATALMRGVEEAMDRGVGVGLAAQEAVSEAEITVECMAEAEMSGSTICVAIYSAYDRELGVANVGDCEAVLITETAEVDLITETHKAFDGKERARINAAGGKIQGGYVITDDGIIGGYRKSLGITRSLGDRDMRAQGIISEPFVYTAPLPKENCMVIIGSDGLWGDDLRCGDLSPHTWFGEAAVKYIGQPAVAVRKLFQMIGKPEDDATVVCMRMDASGQRF